MKKFFIGLLLAVVSLGVYAKPPFTGKVTFQFDEGLGRQTDVITISKSGIVRYSTCGTECELNWKGEYDATGMCYFSDRFNMPVCLHVNKKQIALTNEDGYLINECISFEQEEVNCLVNYKR